MLSVYYYLFIYQKKKGRQHVNLCFFIEDDEMLGYIFSR